MVYLNILFSVFLHLEIELDLSKMLAIKTL